MKNKFLKFPIVLILCLVILSGCSVAPTSSPDPDKEAFMALMPEMYGEWHVLYISSVGAAQRFSINEDGSFTYGDRSLTWRYHGYYKGVGQRMEMEIYEGDTRVGLLEVYIDQNNEYTASLELDSLVQDVKYYNPGKYEIIDLTVESFTEYFELEREMLWVNDSFGEWAMCSYKARFVLKEQYRENISEMLMYEMKNSNVLAHGIIDITYDTGTIHVEVSPEDRTYSYGTFIKEQEMSEVSRLNYSEEGVYFYCRGSNIYPWDIDDKQTEYNDNFRVTRANGQLAFLIK